MQDNQSTEQEISSELDGTFIWYDAVNDEYIETTVAANFMPQYIAGDGKYKMKIVGHFKTQTGSTVDVRDNHKRRFR